MGDPILAAKLATVLGPDDVDPLLLRQVLASAHRSYLTSAPYRAGVDAFAQLLPSMARGLSPLERSALAALLPGMLEGMVRDTAAYDERVHAELRRLAVEGGRVRPPAGPFPKLGPNQGGTT